jgi:uncharacterized RDD family membrane protein YckC
VARALIRFLVLTVVALGVLVILFDNKRRALHDLIAGTVVVHSAGPVR